MLTSKASTAVLALLFAQGSSAALSAQQSQNQQPLPEGDGRELVESVCTRCHGMTQIRGSVGYNAAGWRDLMSTMVRLPESQASRAANYLAAHFPERPGREPTLVPGDVEIEITEWIVPTLGQRSRDPAEAPDGSIWWTGMWASLAGRLDPFTGAMEEYVLPESARPHTIVPDADGNIWYTGNSNATVGKLDPRTGAIVEYPTQARDPHSAVFHPNGKLYFTAQGAAMVGRLDPTTGELTEVATEPNPYDIKVDERGTLWIAYNGTNKIGAMDAETMQVRYYEVPDARSRIRRLAIDSKGMVWYGNSPMGKIGRLDPATGATQEWLSPSGPDSYPYALEVVNDVVWYNESGVRPDVLVRFDPATERFQSFPIPSGYGIIRNMWVTREGHLLIHQTSSNRIGLVRIKDPRLASEQ
jgi:virginiamycin B lyase